MKKILAILLLLFWAGVAQAATLLPNGEQQFFDNNGNPLSSGTVEFYIPSTTTPKNTWRDAAQTILNTNPVQLNAGGRAIIYGSGVYRQIVKDSLGNVVWDQVTADTATAANLSWGGTGAGTANAQTIAAGGFSSVDGQVIFFIAGVTNTGPTTISVSGGAPIAVLKDTPNGTRALEGGEITAAGVSGIVYDANAGSFHLITNNAQAFGLVASIPTGSTVNLGSAASHIVKVTGSGSTIQSFGGITASSLRNSVYLVRFEGNNLISYDATSMITPIGRTMHVSAGDELIVTWLGGSNWQIVAYIPANNGVMEAKPVNAATYTVLNEDERKVIQLYDSVDIAVSLPRAILNFGKGFSVTLQNIGASVITVTSTTSTINGQAAFIIPPYNGVTFLSDGANWFSVGATPVFTQRVLLASQTASTVSTLSFPDVFSNIYTEYEIVFDKVKPVSSANSCRFEVRASGTYQNADYINIGTITVQNAINFWGASELTYIPCSYAGSLRDTNPGINGTFRVSSPTAGVRPSAFVGNLSHPDSAASAIFALINVSGFWNSSTALEGFRVRMVSGNIESGTIKVYGWR